MDYGIIRAFFFDLDGTLVDTHDANFQAYSKAIAKVTGKKAPGSLRNYIKQGLSSNEFIPLVIPDISLEDIANINLLKKTFYKDFADTTILNDYLASFLKNMSAHSTVALVTTAKQANAEIILDEHGLNKYFSFCVYGDNVSNMKPHPEAYILALDKAGVKADEALAFEDSEKGLLAAKQAGIRAIHIKDFI